MAKINDGTLREWKDGDVMDSASYEQDRSILTVAINDNQAQLDALHSTTGAGLVGIDPITGVAGNNVQDALQGLLTDLNNSVSSLQLQFSIANTSYLDGGNFLDTYSSSTPDIDGGTF